MFASKTILLYWITFIAPFIISWSMRLVYDNRIAKDKIFAINKLHTVLTMIQTIVMIYISFVPFYSYHLVWWDKLGIFIHLLGIHLIFIVIPIYALIHSAIYYTNIRDSRVVGWLFVYSMINVMTIIYYFAFMLKLCKGMIKFQKTRRN